MCYSSEQEDVPHGRYLLEAFAVAVVSFAVIFGFIALVSK